MPKIILKSEIPEGEGRTVEVDGIAVALFCSNGAYYAMDGTCPHAGGPLGDGFLHQGKVTCPWHGWQFDLQNGECTFSPEIKQDCYRVHDRGDSIEIESLGAS